MSAKEPARGVNLQKALKQAFGDPDERRLPKGWRQFFSCGCTPATTCAACERAIDAKDYEMRYGNPDDWDPDR